jgi:hypothetical protein
MNTPTGKHEMIWHYITKYEDWSLHWRSWTTDWAGTGRSHYEWRACISGIAASGTFHALHTAHFSITSLHLPHFFDYLSHYEQFWVQLCYPGEYAFNH